MPVKPVTTDPIEKQFVSSWRHLNRKRRKARLADMTLQDYMNAQYSGTIGRWSHDKPRKEEKQRKNRKKSEQSDSAVLAGYEELNRQRCAKGLPPISKESYRKNWMGDAIEV